MSEYAGAKGAKYRVSKRVYKRWEEEITKPRLKGKISFEDSIQMLINLCMTCPPEDFPENVHRLFWSLPKSWRDDELLDEYEEAIEEVEYVQPQQCCGVVVTNCEELPPRRWIETETDWNALFNAILNCYNRRNLLIPKERVEVVTEEE